MLKFEPRSARVGAVDAVRCLECGETRWTLFGETLEHMLEQPCQVCGGKTVVERRRPGTSRRTPPVERRDRVMFTFAPGTRRSRTRELT
jgi:hypothetical protein